MESKSLDSWSTPMRLASISPKRDSAVTYYHLEFVCLPMFRAIQQTFPEVKLADQISSNLKQLDEKIEEMSKSQ
jgi:hypothetical protein